MAEKRVAVGDVVAHDGTWPGHEDEYGSYTIRLMLDRGVVFENDRYKVACVTADLVWHKEWRAWFLPGRLFSVEQRRAIRRVLGLPDNSALPDDRELLARLTPAQLRTVDQRADEEFRIRDRGRAGRI